MEASNQMSMVDRCAVFEAGYWRLVRTSETKSIYEPYIDGLRAVAVLLVVLFHLDFHLISGGFIGVDVFFVISGFLITRNILNRLDAGNFSFTEFYIGRIRRLLPALLVTIFITVLAAGALLPPMHLEKYGQSGLYALLHLSNIHFYQTAGYFDTSSELKPLLHLWSLSVEEQFYLIWPIVIALTFSILSRQSVLVVVAGLGVLSLIATEYFLIHDPDAAFYLPVFRIYEFGIGALIVHARRWKFTSESLSMLLFTFALLLLLYQATSLTKIDPFPGITVLVTCACSAAMLWLHSPSWIKKLLESRPSTFIGRISYSLYLTHWPIIVFAKHILLEPLTPILQIGLLVASIGSAYLLHSLVENPLRHPSNEYFKLTSKPVIAAAASMIVVSAVIFVNMQTSQGWAWRYTKPIQNLIASVNAHRSNSEVKRASRLPFDSNKTAVLIIGDSHATDLFNALHFTNKEISVRRAGVSVVCQPVLAPRPQLSNTAAQKCTKGMERILDGKKSLIKEADIVVLAARWQYWTLDYLPNTIEQIRHATNARIVIAGPTIEFIPEVPDLIARFGKLDGLANFASDFETPDRRLLNQRMALIADELNVAYLNKIELLCGDQACPMFLQPDPNNAPSPLFIDYGHWTMDAARMVGEQIWRKPQAAAIFDAN